MQGESDRLIIFLLLFGTAAGATASYLHKYDDTGVRWGEIASGGSVIAAGAVLTRKAGDPFALCVAAVLATTMMGAYTYMRLNEPEGED